MILKKNHALQRQLPGQLLRERGAQRGDAQALDEPLHDAKVVHHLHEGDEEDDGRELEPHRTERLTMSRIESDVPC